MSSPNQVVVSQVSDVTVVEITTAGPQGIQGPQGLGSATVTIGTTTTGDAGTDAAISNTGTDTAAVLSFTIPRGNTGAQGLQGIQGPQGEKGDTGDTGAQGIQGIQGTQGPQGDQGPVGNTGAFGGATFEYQFNTSTTDADPGNGKLSLNNSTLQSATVLFIDDTDKNSIDIQPFLRTIDDSTSTIKGHFKISEESNPDNFRLYTISAATEDTGYHKITCAYVSGDATFSNDENIVITFARTGDKGDTGAQGPQGIQGVQGVQGIQGNTGATGPAGSSATISVGTVTTGAAGSSVTVTNSGSSSAATFDFSIPRGATGAQGPAGADGADGAISDGDKGDLTVSNSGATFTIDTGVVSTTKIADNAVTYAKMQNVSATDRVLGRDSGGAGVVEEITPANLRTMINVEDGATADQTDAEIKTAYENNSDTNVFTDAEKTKLSGIEANATADQTDAEIRAAVEAATDSNVFTDADHSKLNGIEATADVTDATNVNAAGAVMNSDLDGKGELLVGDGSGDPTALPVGTDGYVLKADSNEATGVKWSAAGSGGDTNQNAFSNVAVSGQDTVAADSTTDTLNIAAGSNVTITTNASNDTVTIASTDTNTTYSVGDGGLTQNNFTDALKTKLDGIEASATADQTASEIVALVADQTIAPSAIQMADNEKIELGDSQDLEISHTGTDATIQNTKGNLNIKPKSGEDGIKLIPDGGVQLYYDNTQKFSTSSTGCSITGTLTTSGDVVISSEYPNLQFIDTNHDSDFRLTNGNGSFLLYDITNSQTNFKALSNGSIELFHAGSKKLETSSDGVDISGNLELDGGVINLKNSGSQSELRLYCEVSNAHYASIKAPAHADFSGNITFTLPSGYGSSGQVLQSNGSGGTSWVAQTTAYTNSSVDSHLNISSASSGQILSWNGSDYAWVADQTGSGISNLVEDTTPQLGGNLDMQTNNITGTGTITANSVASTANGMRKITTSTSAPSGGADGDIWIKYTA